MGVDRIGQGGPPAPVPETGGASRATPAGSAFQVQPSAAAPAASPAASPSSALERFRAGEVDVGGYVDLKVDEATSHLSASLPASQLEAIRSALRERISSDPSLVELLEKATGETVPPLATSLQHDD
jgi:hypothetical protein